MNLLPQFQRCFRSQSPSLGFTLTEILVSTFIVSSAIAVSGIGLSAIIASSQSVNEGNERQDELNRALDFISAEIREAQTINDSSLDPATLIPANPNVKPGSIEPIIWLNMAKTSNVFYYLAKPADSRSFWQGEKVVYRWGPEFDEKGQYKTTRGHSVLIDSLQNETDSTSINCPSLWNKYPNAATNIGFYACVDDSNRVASLFQVGQINQVLEKTKPMLQERQIYSRSLDTLTSLNGFTAPTSPCSGPSCSAPTPPNQTNPLTATSNGYVVMEELTEFRLNHMGGAITCGKGGKTIPTVVTVLFERPNGTTFSTELTQGSITRRDVPRGTKVSFSAKRQPTGNCREYSVDSRFDLGTQIRALENGQSIPYYQPFDNQNKIDQFLSNYLVDNGKKVAIGQNQRVFLFEVGEAYSSNPSSAYDFQDIVLMADMSPTVKAVTSRQDKTKQEN